MLHRTRLGAGVLAVALVAGGCSSPGAPEAGPEPPGTRRTGQQVRSEPEAAAAAWLDYYVDPGGRVVHREDGGATLGADQGYALLLAVATDDAPAFERIWRWTEDALLRPDGLLARSWTDGRVDDTTTSSDADLDVVRALVLAGRRFDRPDWTRAGRRMGDAVLAGETVSVPGGRVLLADDVTPGQGPPYAFNPSHVSPATTQLMRRATGDPRWLALENGSRRAVETATPAGGLPPDWARVASDGTATASPGPAGQPIRFGYDAARTVVRLAESCQAADRALAARWGRLLPGPDTVSVYTVDGRPASEDRGALGLVAAASAAAAAGDQVVAREALDAARATQRSYPSTYGGAWSVLGPLLLTAPALGGCPPLTP